MIEAIAETGDVVHYDPDELQDRVKQYFEKIGRGWPDGRYWRRDYSEADVDVTQLPESKVREFAGRIPDDVTWDENRIGTEFGDHDAE